MNAMSASHRGALWPDRRVFCILHGHDPTPDNRYSKVTIHPPMTDRLPQHVLNTLAPERQSADSLPDGAGFAPNVQDLPAQDAACPMDALLQLLSSPWTTAILWTLQRDGALRFGVLRQRIPGVSARLLTARLRRLMDAGMVQHIRCDAARAERRYALTRRGHELGALFSSLHAVVQRWAMEDRDPSAG